MVVYREEKELLRTSFLDCYSDHKAPYHCAPKNFSRRRNAFARVLITHFPSLSDIYRGLGLTENNLL